MSIASLLRSLRYRSSHTQSGWAHRAKRSAGRPRPRHRRPEAECLEDRTLLTVEFAPGPYLTPANRPDVPLGIMNFSVGKPNEPILAVNNTDPANIAVSSQDGIRITTNAGATFNPKVGFAAPAGSNDFEG